MVGSFACNIQLDHRRSRSGARDKDKIIFKIINNFQLEYKAHRSSSESLSSPFRIDLRTALSLSVKIFLKSKLRKNFISLNREVLRKQNFFSHEQSPTLASPIT